MRKMTFGSYDTQLHGPWTLAQLELTPAQHRQLFVEVPGRDGELDLSTVLTDGSPRYGNRVLTAILERSDGSRETREAAITDMINQLDGWRMDIELPDDPAHYMTGRVSVARNYNDLAHAAVTVTATVDPWKYSKHETVHRVTATTEEKAFRLTNGGRRAVVPTIEITGSEANVLLKYEATSWALNAGTHQIPDLVIPPGGIEIRFSGSGVVSFTYREASL